jgi:hypothetical protein
MFEFKRICRVSFQYFAAASFVVIVPGRIEANAQALSQLDQKAIQQFQQLEKDKAGRTPAQSKISSDLLNQIDSDGQSFGVNGVPEWLIAVLCG